MNFRFFEKSHSRVVFQRNFFLGTSIVLALAAFSLCVAVVRKSERVVLVPPNLQKSVWIDSEKVSPSYVEQQGIYLSQLLFSKTYLTAKTQRQEVLKHTSPMFLGILNNRLISEENTMKEDRSSLMFFVDSVEIVPGQLSIRVQGVKEIYSNGRRTQSNPASYRLDFLYQNNRLLLDQITNTTQEDGNV